jgi:simple sugar transport system ATP-binding protein
MSVSQNLIAGYHCNKEYCRYGVFNFKKIRTTRDRLVKTYDIRLSSTDPLVSELSGGNAQKIIIAREFSADPDLLLASQPTRGVDIGATEFVHSNLLSFRKSGKAILLISSDLSEVMSLSDRIVVMYRGRITGEFDADDVTREELGLYMAGSTHQEAAERERTRSAKVMAANL